MNETIKNNEVKLYISNINIKTLEWEKFSLDVDKDEYLELHGQDIINNGIVLDLGDIFDDVCAESLESQEAADKLALDIAQNTYNIERSSLKEVGDVYFSCLDLNTLKWTREIYQESENYIKNSPTMECTASETDALGNMITICCESATSYEQAKEIILEKLKWLSDIYKKIEENLRCAK